MKYCIVDTIFFLALIALVIILDHRIDVLEDQMERHNTWFGDELE